MAVHKADKIPRVYSACTLRAGAEDKQIVLREQTQKEVKEQALEYLRRNEPRRTSELGACLTWPRATHRPMCCGMRGQEVVGDAIGQVTGTSRL